MRYARAGAVQGQGLGSVNGISSILSSIGRPPDD